MSQILVPFSHPPACVWSNNPQLLLLQLLNKEEEFLFFPAAVCVSDSALQLLQFRLRVELRNSVASKSKVLAVKETTTINGTTSGSEKSAQRKTWNE